jgi:hypothetical protein
MVSFLDGAEIVRTEPRELIADLDSLPMPDPRRRSISRRNVARFNCCLGRAIWNAVTNRREFLMNLPSWYDW